MEVDLFHPQEKVMCFFFPEKKHGSDFFEVKVMYH